MTGRRSEYFVNGVDYDWHRGPELQKAVKQFHDRWALGTGQGSVWTECPQYPVTECLFNGNLSLNCSQITAQAISIA